ncbi:cell wall-binding repeat-containing protein [Microbacterium sp. AR7-10]|uniref:cell wall-binding repeat-containing protein n=1 Tax=Microbacterium sp. AR7-10 TaxID=1891970 RepID=UPI0008FC3F83|nr:cell wall-binding repeat-containing protein [Microbacterium sp. AR7-10]OIU86621.1 hypothetical protein BFN01_10915 [Microbacterium sp. AR7-10]
MKSHTLSRAGAALTTAALLLAGGALSTAAASASPAVTSVVRAAASTVDRIAGASRYDTALQISRRTAPGVKAVFIATGQNFPDALSATTAAASVGGPVLLTKSDSVWPGVLNEVKRLAPERIYVLGGPTVISSRVVETLATAAPVQRIFGSNRYETSRKLVAKFSPRAEQIVLATGRHYADALVAGAAAGDQHIPVLMVDGAKATLDNATRSLIAAAGAKKLWLAGGHGAISIPIEQSARTSGLDVTRVGGATRYDTAAAVNAAFAPDAPQTVFVATGEDFPDALTSAAMAAQSNAILTLSRATCMPRANRLALGALPDVHRVAIGGVAVVSDAAANGASCGEPAPVSPSWKLGGFTFRDDVPAPYSDRPTVNVKDPGIVLDSTGLRVLNMGPGGSRVDHPVAFAQYGMSALAEYQKTGERVWFDRAKRHAERLVQIRTERDGAWFYPYLFDWASTFSSYTAPWWSGMAQGEALSLFVRMYEQTGDEKWRTAADRTWQSLNLPESRTEPWARLMVGDTLWIEEYAGRDGAKPMRVLNGHIFALFGVYDYWKMTKDAEVLRYLDGAAASVLEVMPKIRVPNGVSYYCWQSGCFVPRWQHKTYHPIHSWQLDTLARLTGDQRFANWAATLRKDWSPTSSRALLAPVEEPLAPSEELLPNDAEAMSGTGVSADE